LFVTHRIGWRARLVTGVVSWGKVPPHGWCDVNNVCIMVYLHCYVCFCVGWVVMVLLTTGELKSRCICWPRWSTLLLLFRDDIALLLVMTLRWHFGIIASSWWGDVTLGQFILNWLWRVASNSWPLLQLLSVWSIFGILDTSITCQISYQIRPQRSQTIHDLDINCKTFCYSLCGVIDVTLFC